MLHPIRSAIESLHAKGLCPRLHIDVTHEDAVCPDFVRERWKQQLVIDLDPSYPLDLAFTEVGVEADLSFGGHVTRCVFPWTAIYVVADRNTGQGKVFEQHIPESLRHQLAPKSKDIDPGLTEVRDDLRAKGGSRRRKRRSAKQEQQPVEAAPAPEEAEAPEESEVPEEAEAKAEETETKADDVSSRRAAFRVIDGGG